MKVPFATFRPMEQELEADFKAAFDRVLSNSWYIGGKEDEAFESAFAAYCGTDYCIGVGNGLDALMLILRALEIGPGDEVLVPSNTYIASALAVTYVGATPVFVEPDLSTYNLDANLIEGMACIGGCIGGAGCLTHGEKNKAEVDKYGREAYEKTISDAISVLK